ncbi:hypothetical protein OIV83_006249 [Microbotryomycetes sp. JL201]|nr:hypothetical protein OIV83_006249 [Microbotryomycetes sp. JL201]
MTVLLAVGIALSGGAQAAGDASSVMQLASYDRPTAALAGSLAAATNTNASSSSLSSSQTLAPEIVKQTEKDGNEGQDESAFGQSPPLIAADKVLQARAPQHGSHEAAAVKMMMMAKFVPITADAASDPVAMDAAAAAAPPAEGRSGGLFETGDEMVKVTRRGKDGERPTARNDHAGHGSSSSAAEGLDALEDKDWDKGPGHAHIEDEDERDEDDDDVDWEADEEEDESDDAEQGSGWWRRLKR